MMFRAKTFHAALLILILANVPVFKTECCKALKQIGSFQKSRLTIHTGKT